MAPKKSIAIISGACGDIGREIAIEMARRGASVELCDIVEPRDAEGLVQELRAIGRYARYTRVDVTDEPAVTAWIRSSANDASEVRWVIAAAATVTMASAMTVGADRWRRELDVNLNGSFIVARAGATELVRAGVKGRIVFVGSWAAHAPHANLPAYSVSKAGVRMLCKCMALELASHGIAVNEIAPGFVDAGLSAEIFRKNPGAREGAANRAPVGRLLSPLDVAEQVGYLCFDASEHTTGTVLLMDGGLSLGPPFHPVAERTQ